MYEKKKLSYKIKRRAGSKKVTNSWKDFVGWASNYGLDDAEGGLTAHVLGFILDHPLSTSFYSLGFFRLQPQRKPENSHAMGRSTFRSLSLSRSFFGNGCFMYLLRDRSVWLHYFYYVFMYSNNVSLSFSSIRIFTYGDSWLLLMVVAIFGGIHLNWWIYDWLLDFVDAANLPSYV